MEFAITTHLVIRSSRSRPISHKEHLYWQETAATMKKVVQGKQTTFELKAEAYMPAACFTTPAPGTQVTGDASSCTNQ